MSVEQQYRPSQEYLLAPTIRMTDDRDDITHEVDSTVTSTKKTMTPVIRTTIVSLESSSILQTPSIAVTASTDPTSALTTTKRGVGKRSTKIDFVRFDSVETIFKQSDHNEIIKQAKIKDEINRFVQPFILFVLHQFTLHLSGLMFVIQSVL